MPKTIKDHLENTFDNLDEANLKKFKIKLRDRKQEPRVRQAQIEKVKDSLDLADLMVNTFTTAGAVRVTLEILEVINCNELALELRENVGDALPAVQPNPVAQTHLDVVDNPKQCQGPKVEAVPSPSDPVPSPSDPVPSPSDPVLADDWQREAQVTPCSPQFKDNILRVNGQEIYEAKDKSVRKRLALLINNIDFDQRDMTRRGAERDEENMEWLLNQLDYEVVKHRNLSGQDMKQAVRSFAEHQDHASSDSTFVVIMSHGKRDAILGVHYNRDNPDTFPVDDIYLHLNSQNCPALVNKPKVILIQACRGGEHGRVWASDGEPDESIEGDDFVHKEKDFICLMSCTPDTKSYRHVQKGTFYVQMIVDVFTKHAHEDHIEELFRKVIRRFDSTDMIGSYRQMACKDRASLAKLFYLFPGL